MGISSFAENSNFAELAIFSFHPVKHIASGEGGMITTNDEALYRRLLQLRTHGIVKDNDLYTNSIEFAGGKDEYPSWYMEMQTLGYNYRITDFQAALGNSQLQRADEGVERRRAIAKTYQDAFTGKPYLKGQSGSVEGHAYHLYVLEVEDRLGLYDFLRTKRIFAQIHYIPCHLMPYYRQFGWKEGDRPHAETYYQHCISLPMYPTLTDEEQQYVINCVNEYYQK
ncbi:MAG: DegT/DnrJ/EryC1/StrS family aminotransferase [Taibaiella sp.]|nr:DegT/DnrJ/EryC1/StrS family aminotransferase [Taibaiella sp.]